MDETVQDSNVTLDHAKLLIAARARYREALSWEDVAKRVSCSRNGLLNVRKTRPDDWKKAVDEVVDEMVSEGLPTAWGCFLRAAHQNDVAAAKEIMLRILGAVKQSLDINAQLDPGHLDLLNPDELEEYKRLTLKVRSD